MSLPLSIGSYPITCSECGTENLNEYFTSHALELRLCRPCYNCRVEQGLAQEE